MITPSMLRSLLRVAAIASAIAIPRAASAENGSDLWLRYRPLPDAVRTSYSSAIRTIVVNMQSPTGDAIAAELSRGLKGLLGRETPRADRADGAGALIVGTVSTSPAVAALGWDAELRAAGEEGYVVRAATVNGHPAIVVASIGEPGALYGMFRFLRLLQTHEPIASLDIADRPRLGRRLLDHWDNLDGSIERGYAGRSLFWPSPSESRIVDYARANASIGINGSVINSVNANPEMLTAPWLDKASAIARVLRPYRIRVYLAANFAAPVMIGGLKTNDPRDAAVARWWREKADEIYRRIPDFGGFVVKANSEGQPGPQDYGRTHADGANVLADAVAPHGGVVMWRAFVYNAEVDRDRVKRAYAEFVPLDGSFRGNVFAQVKNGPLDFQPREPFHPLFGAMPKTPLMAELQITQEYLGQSTHAVYLAPMWTEFLNADTYARGPGSFVSRVVDGSLEGKRETGMAGVANTGLDDNWTGHDLAQVNWYAFGRLAWSPSLDAMAIADEWIAMTWSAEPIVAATIRSILLDSREAYVHYTMPLGLHHLIGGDHYAPMPENTDPRREDWSATTYHRADARAIGFDRTRKGSGAVDQYPAPLRERWSDPASTPDDLLLWFHRLPWMYRMKSGRTLWDELVFTYTRGADEARGLEARWTTLAGKVDDERYGAVLARLGKQAADAAAWRDKCLRYFEVARMGRNPALAAAREGSQPSKEWTAADDHRQMLEQLGIRSLRPGPSGNEQAPNHANYDEAAANPFPVLPDPLTFNDGRKVATAQAWWRQRRGEIVEMFEREVYGRVPAGVPAVSWTLTRTTEANVGGRAVVERQIVGHVDNSGYPALTVDIAFTLVLPAAAPGPVPVVIMFRPRGFPGNSIASDQLIARGWGYASLDPASIQADNGAGLTKGIIGLVNKGQPRQPEDWGALRAWAWGASRAFDYLQTDRAVDTRRVGIEGVSRYGKAALVTMAFDQRFAMVLVGSSGEGGAKLHRRNFGEAVENLTGSGEYHWMAGNFLTYGAADASFASRNAGDLPVDAHELIALCAPRLTFISYGVPEKGDAKWLDHQGSFMAAIAAQPVFRLLGAKDLGRSDDYRTEKMPAVNVGLLEGQLAWRQHDGGHTDGPNWEHFLAWAERLVDAATVPRMRTDPNSQLAHEALLRKKTQGQIDLYFIGDSIVRRWGALDYPALLENWRANFFGWNAANFGWGADRVENILWRLDNGELEDVNPKVIVVLAGTNNIGREPGGEGKVADIAAGIKAIVDRCRAQAPRATIIVTSVFPRNDSMAVTAEIARLNETIARLADRRSIIYLDVGRRLAGADGRLRPGMMNDDRLHPTITGYQAWADALKPVLTRLLGPRGKTDSAPPPTGDPSAVGRR